MTRLATGRPEPPTDLSIIKIRIRVKRHSISIERVTPLDHCVLVAIEMGFYNYDEETFWEAVDLIREASVSQDPLSRLSLGNFLTGTVMEMGLYRQFKDMPGSAFIDLMVGCAGDRLDATEHQSAPTDPVSYRDLRERLRE